MGRRSDRRARLPPSPGTGYAPGPFAFADPAFVSPILAQAGFLVTAPAPVDYTYRAGEGDDPVADAAGFFQRIGPAARAIAGAAPGDRPVLLERLHAFLARHVADGAVDFPAAAWIWSVRNAGGTSA